MSISLRKAIVQESGESLVFAYRLNFLPVQLASVQHDGVDGVACSCGLDGSRGDIQQLLEREGLTSERVCMGEGTDSNTL